MRLDGNAIAGMLHEIYGAEMTTARGTCDHCGTTRLIGEAHVHRGAGVVLRCPHCGQVLGQMVRRGSTVCIGLLGLRSLER